MERSFGVGDWKDGIEVSLLATTKLNGPDPAAWLRETLTKLPTCRNSQLDSLLPLRKDVLQQFTPTRIDTPAARRARIAKREAPYQRFFSSVCTYPRK